MGAKRAKTKGRRLEKVDHHAKRQKMIRNGGGIFLILIMITSIFGVMLYASPSSQEGNQQLTLDGYTFTLQEEEGMQYIEMTSTPPGKELFVGSVYYAFPQELVTSYFDPSISAIASSLLNASSVYLVTNASNLDITGQDQTFALDYQAQDIAKSGLAEVLMASEIEPLAGLAEESLSFQIPVISCDNATASTKVLLFSVPSELNTEQSSVSFVENNSNCIRFDSTDFRTTLDLAETLKFEMVKLYE